jgi:hypothetical protein
MLTHILTALESAPYPVSAETLARWLNKDIAVVAAMLDELCLMGRIQLVSGGGACDKCLTKVMCSVSISPGPAYALIVQADDSEEESHNSDA